MKVGLSLHKIRFMNFIILCILILEMFSFSLFFFILSPAFGTVFLRIFESDGIFNAFHEIFLFYTPVPVPVPVVLRLRHRELPFFSLSFTYDCCPFMKKICKFFVETEYLCVSSSSPFCLGRKLAFDTIAFCLLLLSSHE